MANCENCGRPLPDGEHFCSVCGAVSDPAHPAFQSRHPAPPEKSSPFAVLGSWGFLGSMLLLSLPVVGFILQIVWACGGVYNRNRRNLARAYLLFDAVVILAYLALFFLYGFSFETISRYIAY